MRNSIFILVIIFVSCIYSLQACDEFAQPYPKNHATPELSEACLLERHATGLFSIAHQQHLDLHGIEAALNDIADPFKLPSMSAINIPLTVTAIAPTLPFCNLFGGLTQKQPLPASGIKSSILDAVTKSLLRSVDNIQADSVKKQFDTLNTHALRVQMTSALMAQYMVLHALPKKYLFTNKGMQYLNEHTNIPYLMTRMLSYSLTSSVIPEKRRGTIGTELLAFYRDYFSAPTKEDIISIPTNAQHGISQLHNSIVTAYRQLEQAQQEAICGYYYRASLMSLRLLPVGPTTHQKLSKTASNNTKLNALKKKKNSHKTHLSPVYKEMMLLENNE